MYEHTSKLIDIASMQVLSTLEKHHAFNFSEPLSLAETHRLMGFLSTLNTDDYPELSRIDDKMSIVITTRLLGELNKALNNMTDQQGIKINFAVM